MMKEYPFQDQRKEMVDRQLRARGIRDKRVLDAFARVPRHFFVPVKEQLRAYGDYPLPIGEGQTISQPYMVALMTEALQMEGEERVLEIGTGSGYQTAILAELSQKVISVERIAVLLENARATLSRLGYGNIVFRRGDGTLGCSEDAPYDRILVTAGAPELPDGLMSQLSEDGILVAPVGGRDVQTLIRCERTEKGTETERLCSCVFVPLVGEHGWKQGS